MYVQYEGVSYGSYVYPRWADAVGWLLVVAALGWVPVIAVVESVKAGSVTRVCVSHS
jgi:hypothetical protein